MNCKEWKQQFNAWLHGEWVCSENKIELPAELVVHAESCTHCSFTLAQLHSLENRQVSLQIPDESLADRISARLHPILGKKPQSVRTFGPVLVFAGIAAALTVMVFTLLFFQPENTTITVRFTLTAPGAQQVSVVGDWNGWDPATHVLSDPNNDGVWEVEIPLQRNKEYRYQFNINGDLWIPDPGSSLQVDDGFGGKNSVLGI
ncbi:MAG: hypothetical protein EHM28_08055 [Spirochaetaceae bacterium]|nr:MAG: hypothetical protein EHM28_08055 [Spirochaetaceae bacterium]